MSKQQDPRPNQAAEPAALYAAKAAPRRYLTPEGKPEFDLTEIINGREIVAPSPFNPHQDLIAYIFSEMNSHVRRHALGKVKISPLDVIFEEKINVLQPDFLFIRKENMGIVQDWIRGVPDLVGEVVSKSSAKLDMGEKKAIYERYGVPEYWLINPLVPQATVFALKAGQYTVHAEAGEHGPLQSQVLPGFTLEAAELWAEYAGRMG